MTKTATKPAVKGTYGTMYYVKDMKKSVEFYKNNLGLKTAYESPEWSEFSLGGHSLCLHPIGKEGKRMENGCQILHVEGIRDLVADLKKKGVTVFGEVHEVHPGAYSAEFADPSGNVVSLYEGPKSC